MIRRLLSTYLMFSHIRMRRGGLGCAAWPNTGFLPLLVGLMLWKKKLNHEASKVLATCLSSGTQKSQPLSSKPPPPPHPKPTPLPLTYTSHPQTHTPRAPPSAILTTPGPLHALKPTMLAESAYIFGH